jgi:hypothetical protein
VHPGEAAGSPISPGVVRGPVKVLLAADEKPLLRGEILVARASCASSRNDRHSLGLSYLKASHRR